MMKRCWLIFALPALAFLSVGEGAAQTWPGKPLTYSSFDYVQAVTASMSYVYFATTGGVIKYDKIRQSWEEPLTGAEGYPTEDVREIRVDRFDQTLVLVTDLSIYEYDDFFNRWYPVTEMPQIDNDIRHIQPPDFILPDFDANYMGSGQFVDYLNRSFVAVDFLDDRSGDYWIGTWGYGPALAHSATGEMELIPYGLLQERVDFIERDDAVFWLGGDTMGAFRTGLTAFNPDRNEFTRLEAGVEIGFPEGDIYCLEADSARLYLGTPVGLYIVDRQSGNVEGPTDRRHGLADDIVLSLARLDHDLYVGTSAGLNRINLTTDSIYYIRSETFTNQAVYDLERIENTVWIGSQVGAFRYTPATERLQQFQDDERVLFGAVLNVAANGDEIWFASDAGAVGLNRVTGEATSYQEASALTERRALAVNDELIALADDYGLTLIVRDDKKDRYLSFDENGGLPSQLILALYLEGDYLWIGTDRGLTRLDWTDPLIVD